MALRPDNVVAINPQADRRRLTIAHETPGRLRVRLGLLGLPRLDIEHLSLQLRSFAGVRAVRINPDALSIVVEFEGDETREHVLDHLASLRRGDLRFRRADSDDGPSVAPLAVRLGLAVGYNLLPRPVARGLVLALVAPRVLEGAGSLLTSGVTVDVLDTLAVVLGIARGQFRTALTTDFMMSTGEYLEETTIRRSNAQLLDMLMPNPEKAWVVRQGATVEVPFAEVVIGDTVVVNAGELVPVDGVVQAGEAQVNQASITGESVPVSRSEGQRVIAGSLIESGLLRIAAQQVGDDTTTAQIAQLIRDSLENRSDTERLAQSLANKQVYVTLGLGAATFALTRDLRRLSSVFLVDYACPLKLSAPVAVRSIMSEAVSRGILIKGGPIIEKLAAADTLVFDKTGTLTHGVLTVTDVCSLSTRKWPEPRLLALTASLEEHSQHPIARAIVNEAQAQKAGHFDHGDVHFEVGHGLRAQVDGEEVLIGSRHFLEDIEGVDFSHHEDEVNKLVEAGRMLLYVAVAGKPAGLIGLRDELRHDAAETARRLRASGVTRLVMLTGDRKARSQAFGAELGFDEVHAELRPDDKLRILKQLQEGGHTIAFVGDGVNDAPALAQADIGFSMSKGADIARAAADITLLDDRISAVADARDLTQRAMQIIRTNSTAAIAINSALFIAASTGRMSPVAAAVAHNGSTFALLVWAMIRARE